jgi:hypothetical protein
MEITNLGPAIPLAVKLWSKSPDVEALGKSVVPTRVARKDIQCIGETLKGGTQR